MFNPFANHPKQFIQTQKRGAALIYPKFLYRRFQELEHAIALTSGLIWLTTLEHMRESGESTHDEHEGTSFWRPPAVEPENPAQHDAAVLENLKSLGIECNGGSGNLVITRSNGYALCTSLSPNAGKSTFGQNCVKISSVEEFTHEILRALVGHFGDLNWCASPRKIEYGRSSTGNTPKNSSFVGSKGNEGEREFRIYLTHSSGFDYQPFLLHAPRVARLCSLMRK